MPNYKGYDYLANVLASHGYIVISVSANGITAREHELDDAAGSDARVALLQHHLALWAQYTQTGGAPFGTKFVNQVDLQRIGTLGHSRGGEAVLRQVRHIRTSKAPFGLKAVFAIAPTNFNRETVTGVPFEVLLPYCDGDVVDLQGVHYYDDARYAVSGDDAPKHTLLAMGANHKYFNSIWSPGSGYPGTLDDWIHAIASNDPHCSPLVPGNQRLSPSEQRAMARTYAAAFFRRYLGDETDFAPLLSGDAPPPPAAAAAPVIASYHPPDQPTERLDVNRFLANAHLSVNALGTTASSGGLQPYDLCGGGSPQPPQCLEDDPVGQEPHTWLGDPSIKALSQLRIGWNSTGATYSTAIPEGARNLSRFRVLQFRAAVNFDDDRNRAGSSVDFSIRLRDAAGVWASTKISQHSDTLFYPPGGPLGPAPRILLNTVRIPLASFVGVNLADVSALEFRFDQRATGAILLTDLAFADHNPTAPSPDFATSDVQRAAGSFGPGEALWVKDTVTNRGPGGAPTSATRYYLSLDAAKGSSDIVIGSRTVPGLNAGAASTATVTMTVPTGTSPGNYFVLACSDALNASIETAEGNNCAASSALDVRGTSGSVDLVETALSDPPPAGFTGASFTVTDTVGNSGAANAASSTTRYYLSLDTVRSGGDIRLTGSRSVTALAVGMISTGSRSVTIPSGTPNGTYRLLACADDMNANAEGTGEANNCRASTGSIQLKGADLVAASLSRPPQVQRLGSSFSVTDTVRNRGAMPSVPSTTRYYLSLDTKKSATDPRLTGARAVPSLVPGATSTGTILVGIPGGLSPGSYHLIACADDLKEIAETEESNNCRVSTALVSITP